MTDLTNPRATVSALLHDVHVLMANMQTAADKLQYWLNATADLPVAALPAAPVLPALPAVPVPVAAAPATAPAKRGRKPKEKHPVLEALTRMAKGWPAKADLADTVVLLTPTHIRTLPNAKIYWDYPCNTGLTMGRSAVSGRELLDVMRRAGAHAQLTASADTLSLQVDGDVVVTLRSQGEFVAAAWDEQAASLQQRPPTKVREQGEWCKATCDAMVVAARVASKDATRPNMNNVLLDKDGYAVATDGHRLEVRPIEYTGKHLLVPSFIMPVLSTCEGSVSWESSVEHLRVIDADGVAFTFARCLDSFPDWRRVMPSDRNTLFALSFDRAALHQRSKAKPHSTRSHWHCQLIDNELQVEEHGGEQPTKFVIPVRVQRPDGDGCLPRFGLDYTYVKDMCEGEDTQDVTLFIEDQFNPILCSTAIGYEHALKMLSPTHIIMPVRL